MYFTKKRLFDEKNLILNTSFYVFYEEEFIFKCLYFEICVIFKHTNIVNKKKLYNYFVITKKKGKGLKIHIIIDLLKIFYHKFKNEQKNDNFYLIID